MKTTRKRYGTNFKARVALEAIRGDLPRAELGAAWRSPHDDRIVEAAGDRSAFNAAKACLVYRPIEQ